MKRMDIFLNKFNFKYVLLALLYFLFPISIFIVERIVPLEERVLRIVLVLISALLFCFLILIIFRIKNNLPIYFFAVAIGITFIIITPVYSPIDEGAHFDYINYIYSEKSLPRVDSQMNSNELMEVSDDSVPSGTRYEAFHPPLYYALSALISYLLPGDLTVRLYALRFLGVLALAITIYFANKSYNVLSQQKILKLNNNLKKIVILLVMLTPGIITRITTLSNEQLAIPLSAIIVFLFLYILSVEKLSYKSTILIGVLVGSVIMTKLTAAFLFPMVLLALLYKKSYKLTLIYSGIVVVIVAPWFLYNLFTYGSLTATAEHLEFVKMVVNPENKQIGIRAVIDSMDLFLNTYWNSQEGFAIPSKIKQPVNIMIQFLNAIMILSLIYSIFITFSNLRKNKGNYKLHIIYFSLIFIAIIANIMLLIFNTIYYDVMWLLGRYLFVSSFPIFFIFYMFLSDFIEDKRKELAVFIFVGIYILILLSAIFHMIW